METFLLNIHGDKLLNIHGDILITIVSINFELPCIIRKKLIQGWMKCWCISSFEGCSVEMKGRTFGQTTVMLWLSMFRSKLAPNEIFYHFQHIRFFFFLMAYDKQSTQNQVIYPVRVISRFWYHIFCNMKKLSQQYNVLFSAD